MPPIADTSEAPRGGEASRGLALPRRRHADLTEATRVAARFATIVMAALAVVFALHAGRFLLAPIFLAVTVGIMFSPLAERAERAGLPAPLGAVILVGFFVALAAGGMTAFAIPLSDWLERLPSAWTGLRDELDQWKQLLESLSALQSQMREITGASADLSVSVEDGDTVISVAETFPAVLAQFLIFLATTYFFLASRRRFRLAVLTLCVTRRARTRVARMFRDMEILVSRYLATITLVNAGLGLAVTLALLAAGTPSPALWGGLAGFLNYVPYLGPAVMVFVLLGVGVITGGPLAVMAVPAALYLFLNFLEAQFVTPHVLGATMTLNPFVVFLSLAFWLWMWGPIGGVIAVPSLLVLKAVRDNLPPLGGVAIRRRSPNRRPV